MKMKVVVSVLLSAAVLGILVACTCQTCAQLLTERMNECQREAGGNYTGVMGWKCTDYPNTLGGGSCGNVSNQGTCGANGSRWPTHEMAQP